MLVDDSPGCARLFIVLSLGVCPAPVPPNTH
jgi:hypothetical protein